jgi:hypothetical protein
MLTGALESEKLSCALQPNQRRKTPGFPKLRAILNSARLFSRPQSASQETALQPDGDGLSV